jgi:hypothetical protein
VRNPKGREKSQSAARPEQESELEGTDAIQIRTARTRDSDAASFIHPPFGRTNYLPRLGRTNSGPRLVKREKRRATCIGGDSVTPRRVGQNSQRWPRSPAGWEREVN